MPLHKASVGRDPSDPPRYGSRESVRKEERIRVRLHVPAEAVPKNFGLSANGHVDPLEGYFHQEAVATKPRELVTSDHAGGSIHVRPRSAGESGVRARVHLDDPSLVVVKRAEEGEATAAVGDAMEDGEGGLGRRAQQGEAADLTERRGGGGAREPAGRRAPQGGGH